MRQYAVIGASIGAVVMFFVTVHAAYGYGRAGQHAYMEAAFIGGILTIMAITALAILASKEG